ncbi:MAG: hypothetical protein GC182_14745 [Rhodopseudomonas sp.]|nr:hypothetical protein [Rhodopseudomonas sp.]
MINRALVTKLMCVGLVAAVMLPVGTMLYPYVSADLTGTQFQAVEAVVSTSLGYGIFAFLG